MSAVHTADGLGSTWGGSWNIVTDICQRASANTALASVHVQLYEILKRPCLRIDFRSEKMTDLADIRAEFLGCTEIEVARADKRNAEFTDDAARPCGHDQNPIGQKNCLQNAVRYEENRFPVGKPDILQLETHALARKCV